MEPAEEEIAVRVVPRRLRAAGRVLATSAVLFPRHFGSGHGAFPPWLAAWLGVVGAALAASAALHVAAWATTRRVRPLALRGGALWLDGARLVGLGEIEDVLVLSERQVELAWSGRRLTLELPIDVSAEDFVRRLPHVSVRRSALVSIQGTRAWSTAAVALLWIAGALLPLTLAPAMGGWALALVALVAVLFGLLKPWRLARVEVGGDGFLVRGVGRRRFVPRARVRSVMRVFKAGNASAPIAVELDDFMPLTMRALGDEEALQAALERLVLPPSAPAAGAELDLLGRGLRSAEQWIGAMRELAGGGGPYRGALAPDQLRAVAEDQAAPPSARAGAILALRFAKERGPRLEGEPASPLVRVALEADEAELAARLEEESAAEEAAASRRG